MLPEEQYLRRNGNNYCLVLISRSMTAKSGTSRMVSLSILASYMVSAKMQWEDTEMAGIILRTMRVVN